MKLHLFSILTLGAQVAEAACQLDSHLLPAVVAQGGVTPAKARPSTLAAVGSPPLVGPGKPAPSAYDIIRRKPVQAQFSAYPVMEDPWKSVSASVQ